MSSVISSGTVIDVKGKAMWTRRAAAAFQREQNGQRWRFITAVSLIDRPSSEPVPQEVRIPLQFSCSFI